MGWREGWGWERFSVAFCGRLFLFCDDFVRRGGGLANFWERIMKSSVSNLELVEATASLSVFCLSNI